MIDEIESIYSKDVHGTYSIHSRFKNGYYLAFDEPDCWGRVNPVGERGWIVLDENKDKVIEKSWNRSGTWKQWLSEMVKKYGKREIFRSVY